MDSPCSAATRGTTLSTSSPTITRVLQDLRCIEQLSEALASSISVLAGDIGRVCPIWRESSVINLFTVQYGTALTGPLTERLLTSPRSCAWQGGFQIVQHFPAPPLRNKRQRHSVPLHTLRDAGWGIAQLRVVKCDGGSSRMRR